MPRLEHCTATVDNTKVSDTNSNDPPDHLAADATFTFQAVEVNTPPAVSRVTGESCSATGDGGSFLVGISDLETAPGDLSLTLTGNTNPTLVPNANVVISGGGVRTVWITAANKKSGAGVLTFTLSDGVHDVSVRHQRSIGAEVDDSLVGTDGSDLLVGGNGPDFRPGPRRRRRPVRRQRRRLLLAAGATTCSTAITAPTSCAEAKVPTSSAAARARTS